jgi:hypothetical protein
MYKFLPSSSLSGVCSLILFPLFATGVNNTPVANLPPVSVTPVVHLDLRLSPRISKKFEMILELLSGAWGKVIHEKNLKQKIS